MLLISEHTNSDKKSHMHLIKKIRKHWTKEKCKEEAQKYKTRSEFIKIAQVLMIKQEKINGLMRFVLI